MFNIAPLSYIVRSKKNNFNVLKNMHVRLWTDHSNTYKFYIIVQWHMALRSIGWNHMIQYALVYSML